MDEKYMKAAIEAALQAEQQGGLPIGAVIVKDGEIIAEGKSMVFQHTDPTEHAETNCIRNACKKVGSADLNGGTLYGTLEPCGMCVSASVWAGLDNIAFGAYREDVAGNPYELKDYSSEELSKKTQTMDGRRVEIVGGVLREECKDLFKNIKGWDKEK